MREPESIEAGRMDGCDRQSDQIAQLTARLPVEWEAWHREHVHGPGRAQGARWSVSVGSDAGYAVRDHELVWCDLVDDKGLVDAVSIGIAEWRRVFSALPDELNLLRLLLAGPIAAGRFGESSEARDLPLDCGATVLDVVRELAAALGRPADRLGVVVLSLREVGATSPWLLDVVDSVLDRAISDTRAAVEWELQQERQAPEREAARLAGAAARVDAEARAASEARAVEQRAYQEAVVTRAQLVGAARSAAGADHAQAWGIAVLDAIERVAFDRAVLDKVSLDRPREQFVGYVATLQTIARYSLRSFAPLDGWMEGAPPRPVQEIIDSRRGQLDMVAALNDMVCGPMLDELADALLASFIPPLRWTEIEALKVTRERPPLPPDWDEW